MKTSDFSNGNVAVLHPERMPRTPTREALDVENAYQRLVAAGIALSSEHDPDSLLAMIVETAIAITGADAGGLYLLDGEDRLRPAVVRWRDAPPMGDGARGDLPQVRLYLAGGRSRDDAKGAELSSLCGSGISTGDGQGADAGGPETVSFLSVPLKVPGRDGFGVLQLINGADGAGEIAPFGPALVPAVEALAAQAAAAIENQRLLQDQLGLFESLVRMIAAAIDAKSPYTGAHCQRVPVIYELLADAACEVREGPFAEFDLTDEQRRELRLAAWLHDCGKVATPEHVVDKATKLETVRDRIEEIAVRIEVIKRDEEIACIENCLRAPEHADEYRARLRARRRAFDDDLAFLSEINRGEEPMTEEMLNRVREIATWRWCDRDGLARPLLSEDEVTNLSIRQGTLNAADREIVNRHVEISIEMLKQLPFPESLGMVTEIAGAHHEKIDGSGYPYGLTGDQMSLPARMLVIADIFEALTAGDRPYKRGKTLREALDLMARMRDDNKIDAAVFELFVTSRVWQTYAENYMPLELRDGVDIDALLRRKGGTSSVRRAEAG